jgi:hypothetical protein
VALAYCVADAYFRSTSGFVPLTLANVLLLLKPLIAILLVSGLATVALLGGFITGNMSRSSCSSPS